MSDNPKDSPVMVIAPPRNARYARRAARPATDKGAPKRQSSPQARPKKAANGS